MGGEVLGLQRVRGALGADQRADASREDRALVGLSHPDLISAIMRSLARSCVYPLRSVRVMMRCPALLLLCLALLPGCEAPPPAFNQPDPEVVLPTPDTNNRNNPQLGVCQDDGDCLSGQLCCQSSCTRTSSCEALAPCERHGDPCPLDGSLAIEAQGDFYCARLAQADGPTCLAACEKNFSADGCPRGSFCLEINAGQERVPLCLPAECQDHGDCGALGPEGGSCVPFGNGAGFCYSAGPVGQGEPCGGESLCAPGLYCLGSLLEATCQPLCDMWSSTVEVCGRERACGYLTAGTGVCRLRTTQGRGPTESCAPQGDWCADGLQCFDFQTGGEPLPVCTAWCRPGTDDCRGRFQDQQGFCRTVFSDGAGEPLEDIGLCL